MGDKMKGKISTMIIQVCFAVWLGLVMGALSPDPVYSDYITGYRELPYGGPGLFERYLITNDDNNDDNTISFGVLRVWNSRENLMIQVEPLDGWLISDIHIYVSSNPDPSMYLSPEVDGTFNYTNKFAFPGAVAQHTVICNLAEDLDFQWGEPWEDKRIQNIAVQAHLIKLDGSEEVNGQHSIIDQETVWGVGPDDGTGAGSPGLFTYELAHPRRGHFNGPTSGLSYKGPTQNGTTDESGGFDYFPGERIQLALGSVELGTALVDHKISPLDVFEQGRYQRPPGYQYGSSSSEPGRRRQG